MIIQLYSQPKYGIEKLSFNSSNTDEFSPAFYPDGLAFCSNRKNSFLISYTDTSGKLGQLIDIFYVLQKKNARWENVNAYPEQVNSLFNEGPFCYYNNFNSIVLTRNLVNKKKFGNYLKDGNTCGIFFAEIKKNKLSRVTKFPYNSESNNVMHPAISNDGKTLVFVSDKEGGMGGTDLYISYLVQDNWTAPENLGNKINTERNEAFPFLHPSGRLFFASKGWNSKGGYDIYYTQKIENSWLEAQSMGDPFNTKYDDFGFIADSAMVNGYFTSNRLRSDDIFKFASFTGDFTECVPQRENNFCYTFFEDGTSEGDVPVGMKYEWDLGDGSKIRALEAKHCFLKPGEYLIKLNVIDSLTGEVLMSQAEYPFEVKEIEQPYISHSEKTKPGQEIQFDADKTNLPFKIVNYYWDFGNGFYAIGANASHIFYEEGTYPIRLSVEGGPSRNQVSKACVVYQLNISKQRK